MPGVARDSLFWFVTAGADGVSGCWLTPADAIPAPAVVRVMCDFVSLTDSNPLFYAAGFGANARRGAGPIGFAEVVDGDFTRKVVDGLDLTVWSPARANARTSATKSSSRSVGVVVSGARLAAFDRLPAVLVTPVSSSHASCSITEPYRPTSTNVVFTVTCTDNVSGFTLGVMY
jgi:hypothetical protein